MLYVCHWVNNIGYKTIFSFSVGPVGPGNGESGLLSKDYFQEGQGQNPRNYHKKVKVSGIEEKNTLIVSHCFRGSMNNQPIMLPLKPLTSRSRMKTTKVL